jgi:hypothetical protein
MRNAIALSLMLAVAAAPVAAAETWKEFVSPDGYVSAIAPDTVKAVGPQRSFRLRVGKIGDTHYAIADAILDCQAKTLTMGNADLFDKGVQTGTRRADPTRPFTEPLGDEPSGQEILAFLCAG